MAGMTRDDLPPLERGGERVGGWLSRAADAVLRVVELPANIAKRRGSRLSSLARLLCWICLFFPVPLLGLWLAMLAWASMLEREG